MSQSPSYKTTKGFLTPAHLQPVSGPCPFLQDPWMKPTLGHVQGEQAHAQHPWGRAAAKEGQLWAGLWTSSNVLLVSRTSLAS